VAASLNAGLTLIVAATVTYLLSSCVSPRGPGMARFGPLEAHEVTDSTDFLQSLLDSAEGEITIPKGNAPWFTRPLFLRAEGKRIIFEEGCEIAALPGAFTGRGECLITLDSCRNVTLSGYGALLSMRRGDYARAPYEKGEWRHGISLESCAGVTLEGLTIAETGGDGVYLAHHGDSVNSDIILKNLKLTDNYRQGVSVIAADRFLMEGCVVSGTKGTLPSAGVDFEPNTGTGGFRQCVIRDCLLERNAGPGIIVYPVKLAGSGKEVEILVENTISRKNALSVSIYGIPGDVKGYIEFRNCELSFPKWIGRKGNLRITVRKD